MITGSHTLRKWLDAIDRVHPRLKVRSRRGHPYIYPTTLIIRCYFLILLHPRLRQHAKLHAFLAGHRLARSLVGLEQVPHRTTFSRRFKTLEQELQGRIWAMGLAFILYGLVEVHVLMADGTLHQAAGPSWPAKYKDQGILPKSLRHVDRNAGWGRSPYHGWVWGYRSLPVVALTPDLEPIPLLMLAVPADRQENILLAQQLPWLPPEATALLLDSAYEDEALVQAWHRSDEEGFLIRWMVIDPKHRRGEPSAWRQRLQVWRHLEEADLYSLRYQLMEPFFAHWKEAFSLKQLPLQGRDAPVYLLLAMYAYQLLIWDNLKTGRPTYAHKHLVLGVD
jgi:hypothetical protein